MAEIATYKPYYIEDGFNGLPTPENPQVIRCIEDRPEEDPEIGPADVQVAASLYGVGFDTALMEASFSGYLDYIPDRALRMAVDPTVKARLHGNKCGGEIAMPDVPTLVSNADYEDIYNGIQALGLTHIGESAIGRAFYVHERYARVRSLVPRAEKAAALLESDSKAPLERVPVIGSHQAPTILSNLTLDPFDTRRAWNEGHPAYNISFAGLEAFVRRIRGELSDTEAQTLLAISAMRHLVTAKAVLQHPAGPDTALEILVNQ